MSDPNQLGVQLIFVPEAYGGMDGGRSTRTVCEVMARHDIGVATAVFATFLGSDPILVGATEEQKQRWLGAIAEDGILFAYGATEPDAGSDLGAMKTTAARIEDETASSPATASTACKQWISNGSIADMITILAMTRTARRGSSSTTTRRGSRCASPRTSTASAVEHRCAVPRRRRGRGRPPDRRGRGQGAGPGPAGVRLHPHHGRSLRSRRRLGSARPRDRILLGALSRAAHRCPRSRATPTS
jgi:hypothetical protein